MKLAEAVRLRRLSNMKRRLSEQQERARAGRAVLGMLAADSLRSALLAAGECLMPREIAEGLDDPPPDDPQTH